MENIKKLCIDLEHFETPEWAARAILKKEILTANVLDPCCGAGILAETAHRAGYSVTSNDVRNWGYQAQNWVFDFLQMGEFARNGDFSVFMNPPFSKACEFVEKSFELGARKILCFQRFSWWESNKRRAFWQKNPPARVWLCGDRATCWRHDLPVNEKGERCEPGTGRVLAGTPTPHAWFIFEAGHTGGTLLGHVWKED